MRHGGWSGPMVCSVQRTEVADVASLFIGCDMKKRTACKIITGIVAVCSLTSTGHCGKVLLKGGGSVYLDATAEIVGTRVKQEGAPYNVNVGCSLCKSYYGPCVSVPASNVYVTGRYNARNVHMESGSWRYGKRGTMIEWESTRPDIENGTKLFARIRCDNHTNRAWTWVDVTFFRSVRYPKSEIVVNATNETKGVTASSANSDWIGSTWDPKWGAVVGTPGTHGETSVTYADSVELRGYKSRARVIYDVMGTVPVTVGLDAVPEGLSCLRTSDGVNIAQGTTALIGAGDSITCVNIQKRNKTTVGALSVTAMIR